MKNKRTVIRNYVEALQKRAVQVGGLNYAIGFLTATLESLNLQEYELERLMADTANLTDLADNREDYVKGLEDLR